MANRTPVPPPGFDDLPLADQVDYVQDLWDRIAQSANQLPLHEWQRVLLDERLAQHRADPSAAIPWRTALDEVEDQLRRK